MLLLLVRRESCPHPTIRATGLVRQKVQAGLAKARKEREDVSHSVDFPNLVFPASVILVGDDQVGPTCVGGGSALQATGEIILRFVGR